MGHAQVWLAVRTDQKPLDALLDGLGFRRTGRFEELVKSPNVIALSRSGWSILVANTVGDRIVRDDRLARLSADCELVAGEAEEHVMVSWLAGWRNGRKIWSVSHDPEKGLEHLDIFGDPPPPFSSIHARLLEEARRDGDDGVDYIFDVPSELSRSLIGYKHDDGVDSDNPTPYEVLESTEIARPFWKKILGLR